LTSGIEQIGRCADADPGEQLLLPGPPEAAGRVGAYGHVGYQPYAHPGFPGAVLSPGQTALGQPLAEGVELQLLRMLTNKLAHFRRPGLTPVRRPASPARPFALFQQVLLEGLMAAVQLQLLAALQAKVLKILLRGDRRTAEALKQPAQYLHAQRGDRKS